MSKTQALFPLQLSLRTLLIVAFTTVLLIMGCLPTLRPEMTTTLTRTVPNSRCDFPLVYNKPPKTASSFIQVRILEWANQVGRTSYNCSRTPLITSAILPECVPHPADPCGIVNMHIFLTPTSRAFLDRRLPGNKLMVSTRYPPHRIISMFLFTRKLKADDPIDEKGLTYYLNQFNPWRLFNYHTGEKRIGSCPLTEDDVKDIYDFTTNVDIVIDANVIEESNLILKHFKLFQLPEVQVKDRNKERGAARLQLSDDIKALLKSKSCVELEMHRALQVRMASLYQMATGRPCIRPGTLDKLDTCIAEKERQVLKDSLVVW